MQHYLLVFLGGGIGSMCRFGLGHLLAPYKPQMPWATFLANLLACLLLGIFIGLHLKGRLGSSWAVLLMAGFCGGFSTFSTFGNETLHLFLDGQWPRAVGYVAGSLLGCLLAVWAGMKLVYE